MMRITALLIAMMASAVHPAAAGDISLEQVVLRGLDKVTGRLSTMTVPVGEKTTFGALDVYARVCYTHPPEETPENAAFLEVVEKKQEGQLKLFSGWMFSSSPALSAMEHPVYDIWVLKCQGEQIVPPKPEPLVLENPIELKSLQPKVKIIWDEEKQTISDVARPIAESTDTEFEKPVDPETIGNADENTDAQPILIQEEPAAPSSASETEEGGENDLSLSAAENEPEQKALETEDTVQETDDSFSSGILTPISDEQTTEQSPASAAE